MRRGRLIYLQEDSIDKCTRALHGCLSGGRYLNSEIIASTVKLTVERVKQRFDR